MHYSRIFGIRGYWLVPDVIFFFCFELATVMFSLGIVGGLESLNVAAVFSILTNKCT
jgi:hypothetical protein